MQNVKIKNQNDNVKFKIIEILKFINFTFQSVIFHFDIYILNLLLL